LSENAEYDAAKEAQGMLEMRIAKKKKYILTPDLIDETILICLRFLLSIVKIKNQTNGNGDEIYFGCRK
jgi:transcription elongation factor GreA